MNSSIIFFIIAITGFLAVIAFAVERIYEMKDSKLNGGSIGTGQATSNNTDIDQ
jgi:hypothetical protein